MLLRIALAIALTTPTVLIGASPQRTQPASQKTPTLAERFPVPSGYSAEQDTESDGAQNFSTANDVRGHILRRFVQAGDDGKLSVAEIARYFADRLHAQNGYLFDDRLNSSGGRLDGRIPGPRPVWLHVDINDEGSVMDIIALEESAAPPREMPVEETRIAGSWSTGEMFVDMPAADRVNALRARDALATLAEPFFKPFQGWAWRVTVEELRDVSARAQIDSAPPYRLRVSGRQRSQACATCPVTTDVQDVAVFTMDVNRAESLDPGSTPTGEITRFKDGGKILITRADRAGSSPRFAVIDVPWKYGVHEVSLYQRDLVEQFLMSAVLTDLVK